MVWATRGQSLEPLSIVIERLIISLLNVCYSLLQGIRLLGGKVLVEEGLVQFSPSVYCSRWQMIIPGSGGILQRETKKALILICSSITLEGLVPMQTSWKSLK